MNIIVKMLIKASNISLQILSCTIGCITIISDHCTFMCAQTLRHHGHNNCFSREVVNQVAKVYVQEIVIGEIQGWLASAPIVRQVT
jgi:acetyltransferase-like isoleucine patch superfamily enzyme